MDPIITCKPWNPVAIKNVEPKVESAIQKGASMYSNAWNTVKTAPRMIVKKRDIFAFLKFFFSISWWDHVMDTPEDNNRIVFSRGILIGLKETIDIGGQACPNSTVGEILLWKKAQKKDTKNRISDEINNTIPVFKPFMTMSEWLPCVAPSRWISRHHEYATINVRIKEYKVNFMDTLFIITNPESTIQRALFEANKGHGLTSTKWKGLNLFVIILLLWCIM